MTEASEDVGHGLVVHLVRAVEDVARQRQRAGQVLGGLRLARARGPLGRAAVQQVDRRDHRAVAPVGQRRDDKPRPVAEVLVRVREARVRLARGAVVDVLLPVVAQLRDPLEVGAAVSKINIDVDRATGVTLADGRVINASLIVSNADPKTTFNKLVGLTNIEAGVARRVKTMRMKGDAAKLHIALDSLPNFNGLSEQQMGQRLVIAPTMNYIETAFNASKYGEYSSAPAMDISIPSVHDASLAPQGKHVMSVIIQYAPYELEGGWDDEKKNAFKRLVIDRIADFAPDLKDKLVASELLTPVDLEDRFHIHGGHWHHGEISLDQILMMRPFPGASQYGTSVDGLYLCGAGNHPGGGVMGLAGHNAAKEIIKRGKSA